MPKETRRLPISGMPNCQFQAEIKRGGGASAAIKLIDAAIYAFAKRVKNRGHAFRARVEGRPGKASILTMTFHAQDRGCVKRLAIDDPRFSLLPPQADY